MKKTIISIIAAISILAGAIPAGAIDVTSKAASVIDCRTGKILYELNAWEPYAPASMTKVMTVYIAYRKMDEGVLSKDTIIYADEQDQEASTDPEATNVYLEAGKGYTVDELIGAILVPSACAASAMLGRYLCGSEEQFADLMNKYVGELGLEAYYEDASGLSDNDRISANSMAILARRLVTEYPDVLNYTSKPTIEFGGRTYNSTNKMLKGGAYEYTGVDGLKTGTTTLAGNCFTGTAERNGNRIVSVTMHSGDRFDDTTELLNYGFDRLAYLYNNILNTTMRIKINGAEVPSFVYEGPDEGVCLIVEDLASYGFDIGWSGGTRTVIAAFDGAKPVKPIPLDYYKAQEPGSIFSPIVFESNIKVELMRNGKLYKVQHVYPLDGYTAISADELINIAESCVWNAAESCLEITL